MSVKQMQSLLRTTSQKLITANVPDEESAQRSVLLRLFFNLYDLVDAIFKNAPALWIRIYEDIATTAGTSKITVRRLRAGY